MGPEVPLLDREVARGREPVFVIPYFLSEERQAGTNAGPDSKGRNDNNE